MEKNWLRGQVAKSNPRASWSYRAVAPALPNTVLHFRLQERPYPINHSATTGSVQAATEKFLF